MFRSANHLIGFSILTSDEPCGKVKDLLFDDESFTVRYLTVDTGSWLLSRKVLISPTSVREPDPVSRQLKTVLTRQQLEDAPQLDSEKPVSRQHEIALASFYDWPVYWGFAAAPASVGQPAPTALAERVEEMEEDTHLRSTTEVTGYHIQCMEGQLGHVEDLILDTDDWKIRHVIVDTRNWLPGRKVMLPVDWMTHFSWSDRTAHIDLTQEQVKNAPEYDPRTPVNREYESRLYDFYGRPAYW